MRIFFPFVCIIAFFLLPMLDSGNMKRSTHLHADRVLYHWMNDLVLTSKLAAALTSWIRINRTKPPIMLIRHLLSPLRVPTRQSTIQLMYALHFYYIQYPLNIYYAIVVLFSVMSNISSKKSCNYPPEWKVIILRRVYFISRVEDVHLKILAKAIVWRAVSAYHQIIFFDAVGRRSARTKILVRTQVVR